MYCVVKGCGSIWDPSSNIIFHSLLATAWSAEVLSFPPGFKFGVASSAYQVEGAWNISDKGESIWDRFIHQIPSSLENGDTGDVACDSYKLWREDIKLVKELGVDFYRISISWPRLLPSGFVNHVSEDGKRYYNNLIDGLLEKGIQPVVTLYHWDLPQSLQDLGGWANSLMVNWFADYARVVYSLYGDRVKTWITINEPWVVCDIAYIEGLIPPATPSKVGAYLCNKNILMAHAKAWRVYDEEFKPKYHGAVSLANNNIWFEPANATDEELTELMREYQCGRFSHPIYTKEGGWPPAVEKAIAEYSEKEGYPRYIMPAFTKEEKEFVKGTYDFMGLNFYFARRVRPARPSEPESHILLHDVPLLNAKLEIDPGWPVILNFFTYYPESIRKELVWLKQHYGDISILITENGRGTTGGLDDQDRIKYFRNYMKQMLLAIKEDGVNVTGYTAWTLMDNYEWLAGYSSKFGLYEVDFSSPNRTRTARASAKFYASVIKNRSLDVPYNFTPDIAPKSSKPKERNAGNIVFGGLVLAAVAIIAAVIGCRVNKQAKSKKKHRYAAVESRSNFGPQNGGNCNVLDTTRSDVKNGIQNDNSNSFLNGVQSMHRDNK